MPPLTKVGGFRGGAIARLRLAQLDWGDDLFDQARPLVESVLKEAEVKNHSQTAEEALFVLARLKKRRPF